jgi:putative transposase
VRCRYLTEHRDELAPLTVGKACGLLRVPPSGFHEFRHRGKSNRQVEREALEGFVADIFTADRARHGYRRVNREPRRTGIVASEKRVPEVMHSLGLQAKGASKRRRRARPVEPGDPRINLIRRVFTVAKRDTLRVGGITYVSTGHYRCRHRSMSL